jgi:hypothetical protein
LRLKPLDQFEEGLLVGFCGLAEFGDNLVYGLGWTVGARVSRDTHLCGVAERDDGETVIILHGTEDSAAGMLHYIQNVQTRAFLGLAAFAHARCITIHGARVIDNEAEIQGCAFARVVHFDDGLARWSNSNEQAFARVFMKSDPEGHMFTARIGLMSWKSVGIEVRHCGSLGELNSPSITLFIYCRW